MPAADAHVHLFSQILRWPQRGFLAREPKHKLLDLR